MEVLVFDDKGRLGGFRAVEQPLEKRRARHEAGEGHQQPGEGADPDGLAGAGWKGPQPECLVAVTGDFLCRKNKLGSRELMGADVEGRHGGIGQERFDLAHTVFPGGQIQFARIGQDHFEVYLAPVALDGDLVDHFAEDPALVDHRQAAFQLLFTHHRVDQILAARTKHLAWDDVPLIIYDLELALEFCTGRHQVGARPGGRVENNDCGLQMADGRWLMADGGWLMVAGG